MELEDLKRNWEQLSLRLENEEVVRRQEMQRLVSGKVRSFVSYSQHTALITVAALPVCVAIGKFRGVSDSILLAAVACFIVLFLPSLWELRLLMRAARCEGNIVEMECRMTRYSRFARRSRIVQSASVGLLVAAMVVWSSGYYTVHGLWWSVAAILSVAGVAVFVWVRYERARLREVQRRIRELREFEAE